MKTDENSENVVPENIVPEEAPAAKKFYQKLWFKILAVVVFLIFLVVFLPLIFISEIATFAVNNYAAELLGVDKVSVEKISLKPFSMQFSLKNLFVGKPISEEKFVEDMLKIESLSASASSHGNKIIIENFELKGFVATYEQQLKGKSNIDVLSEKFASKSDKKSDSAASEADEIFVGAKKFFIDSANIRMVISGVPLPIPPVTIDLENVGLDKDLTATEFGMLVAANFINVLNRIDYAELGNALGSALGNAAGAVSETISDGVDEILDVFDDEEEDSEDEDSDKESDENSDEESSSEGENSASEEAENVVPEE